jgi:hypothetical protein
MLLRRIAEVTAILSAIGALVGSVLGMLTIGAAPGHGRPAPVR